MQRLDKRALMVLSVGLVNLVVIVACPSLFVPPPLAAQRSKVVENLIVSSIPLLWAIVLILLGRSRFTLVVGLVSLVPAIGWLIFALPLTARAFYP
jgi:hypothetical protein